MPRPLETGFYYASLGLSPTGLPLLRDLIVQRSGVFFADEKQDLLADKVAELVTALGLTSFLDYYYLLKYDDPQFEHWKTLMDRLAVPETYFFRQPEQLRTLVDVLVPYLLQNGRSQPVRIWSAACCSGEEPLSIAMALQEANIFARANVEIMASDVSPALVQRAQRGVFGERSFRNLEPHLRARYFTPNEGGGWRIDPGLQARVQWSTANLLDPAEIQPFARADVIFCRNVFIYFSDDAIRRVVHTFAESMPTPGYVFLGAAESLVRLTSELRLEEVANSFVYVKPGSQNPACRN